MLLEPPTYFNVHSISNRTLEVLINSHDGEGVLGGVLGRITNSISITGCMLGHP